MARRVLIIPDKFKGTLTAAAAARAMARGWHRARPDDRLELLPMSDGGDGFGEVMSALLGGRVQRARTVDAAGRPCQACWWWVAELKLAIIESATAVGLALLPPKRFHPFELDTFGLGALFEAARLKGARCCLVGIGGSATNDGGFGLARALGWRFPNAEGEAIERWVELEALRDIEPPAREPVLGEVRVAVDVQNRLLGLEGASRIYGPQKGLRAEDFAKAEACLGRLARVVKKRLGRDLARVPGTGAAGGLGFGLLAFLGARLEPGFELFAREAALTRRLRVCDLVITGEGRIDHSTLMGKGVGQIARQCRAVKVPCIGLAGGVKADKRLERLFTEVRDLLTLTSEEQAKAQAARWLERLAFRTGAEST